MQYAGFNDEIGELRFIRADLDDAILTITLNRPMQRNAINAGLSLEMETLLKAVHVDPDVRVVVLRGAGGGFCAGDDALAVEAQSGEASFRTMRPLANDWRVRLLRLLPQPVIAMVHGYCEGTAPAILEACDIVLAAHDAHFTLGRMDDGMFEDGPTAKAASQMMRPRAASYYAMTGASFDGRQAELEGLATCSLPLDELEAETYALARSLAAKEPIALRFTKETLLHAPEMTWDGVLNFTAAKFAELKLLQMGQPSVRAGAIESFLSGKSKPGLGQ